MPRKKQIVPEKITARKINAAEKRDAVLRMEEAIALSPLLSSLGLTVNARSSHFYLDFESEGETVHMARVTPMADSPAFALESMSGDGWALYGQGTASRIIKLLCNDTLGTFHGLGSIDLTLRNTGNVVPEIIEVSPRDYAYKKTKFKCSLHETLHFYFDIPLEVLLEPREWYSQHATPSLLAVGRDDTRVLVRFCDRKAQSRRILGHCLYALKRSAWWAVTLPDEEGNTLADAEAYFKTVS